MTAEEMRDNLVREALKVPSIREAVEELDRQDRRRITSPENGKAGGRRHIFAGRGAGYPLALADAPRAAIWAAASHPGKLPAAAAAGHARNKAHGGSSVP